MIRWQLQASKPPLNAQLKKCIERLWQWRTVGGRKGEGVASGMREYIKYYHKEIWWSAFDPKVNIERQIRVGGGGIQSRSFI